MKEFVFMENFDFILPVFSILEAVLKASILGASLIGVSTVASVSP